MALAWVQVLVVVLVVVLAAVVVQLPAAVPDRAVAQVLVPVLALAPVPGQVLVQG